MSERLNAPCPPASTLIPLSPGHIRHLPLAKARGRKLPKSSWTKVPRWMEAPRLKVPRLFFPSHPLSILKSLPQRSLKALLFFTQELCTRPWKDWAICLKNDCRLPNSLANTTSSTAAYLQIAAEIHPCRINVLNLEEFQRLVTATLIDLYPMFARYAAPCNITVKRLL